MTPEDALAVFEAGTPMAMLTPAVPFAVLGCNDGFRRLVSRVDGEPLEGRSLLALIAPDEPGFEAALAQAAREETPTRLHHAWVGVDGARRDYAVTLSPVALAPSRAVLLCHLFDLTAVAQERRAFEGERARHAALLQLAASRSLDPEKIGADAASAAAGVCQGPVVVYLLSDGMLQRTATRALDDLTVTLFPVRLAGGHFMAVRDALSTGRSVVRPALPTLSESERRILHHCRAVWMVVTPVHGHRHPLGVIVSLWRGRDTPVAGIQALDLLAGQTATALERAHLYEDADTQRTRLDLILQQMPDGVWMVDADGNLVLSNSTARDLLGVLPTDAGSFLAALEHRIRPHVVTEGGPLGLREALAGQTVRGVVQAFERGEPGRDGWLLVSAAPLLGRHGQTVGAVAVASDVSELRRAELAVALLADVSTALGATLDLSTSCRRVAALCVEQLADWCAIEQLEPTGELRRLAEAPSPPDGTSGDAHAVPHLLASVVEGRTVLVEDPAPDATLTFPEMAPLGAGVRTYLAVPIAAEQRVLGVIHLATARDGRRLGPRDLRLTEEVARRIATAIENARLFWAAREADHRKDEFLAVLSHELRNPLTAILGWAQLLRFEKDPERMQHGLTVLDRNARVQLTLVNDLLDLTAVRQGKLAFEVRALDLRDVVSAVLDGVRETSRSKNLHLEHALPGAPLPIEGDATRLHQVFANLLSNAMKFTPPGGTISVTARVDVDGAVVTVRDTGQGISPEFLPRVFDMFRQSEDASRRGGLGLGLALARQIVERHGGHIDARSDGPGRGAEFAVRLPSRQPSPPPRGWGPDQDRGRQTFLVARGLRDQSAMYALPPGLGAGAEEHITGIGCPECPGVLRVTVEGTRGYLHFRCRIGIAFSTDELIAAKERQFEDSVWAAVTTVDELVRFLKDLSRHDRRRAASFADRIARGIGQSDDLRRILDHAETIDLNPPAGPPEPAIPAPGE